jgi:tagatose 1,6-diphosphate aldolase
VTEASNDNHIERFKDYDFITPPVLVDDDLQLQLVETVPYNPQKGWVPYYRFAVVNSHTGAVMGDIDLRVALTAKLKLMGGHIGYEVEEPYRGRRYATRSCRLLLPFARTLGIDPVLITCAPDNIASVKTIESLGARLIDTYEVEIEPGVLRMTSLYHV